MLTLKILAGLLQLHGPGATIQSDHQGIDALLNNMRDQSSADATNLRRPRFISDEAGLSEGEDTEAASAEAPITRTGADSAEAGSSEGTRLRGLLD